MKRILYISALIIISIILIVAPSLYSAESQRVAPKEINLKSDNTLVVASSGVKPATSSDSSKNAQEILPMDDEPFDKEADEKETSPSAAGENVIARRISDERVTLVGPSDILPVEQGVLRSATDAGTGALFEVDLDAAGVVAVVQPV